MAVFQFRPSPFSDEELAEIDRIRLGLALTQQDREDRINRFDEVPSSSKLETYRKAHRVTQSKMAKMMGVSKRSYCDYESGQTPIPFKALRKLAETTDFDFNELIVGDANRASADYCVRIIQQTRQIVAYCLKHDSQITGTQAFAAAERYVIEYGLDEGLSNIRSDEPMYRIDDCIRIVTYDPEAEGIFE